MGKYSFLTKSQCSKIYHVTIDFLKDNSKAKYDDHYRKEYDKRVREIVDDKKIDELKKEITKIVKEDKIEINKKHGKDYINDKKIQNMDRDRKLEEAKKEITDIVMSPII